MGFEILGGDGHCLYGEAGEHRIGRRRPSHVCTYAITCADSGNPARPCSAGPALFSRLPRSI